MANLAITIEGTLDVRSTIDVTVILNKLEGRHVQHFEKSCVTKIVSPLKFLLGFCEFAAFYCLETLSMGDCGPAIKCLLLLSCRFPVCSVDYIFVLLSQPIHLYRYFDCINPESKHGKARI